jgi:hypothetical protein
VFEAVATGLGATRPVGTSQFVLFVPSVTRDGEPIDHDQWVNQALDTFAALFRGATAFPRGLGRWRDDERGGRLVTDQPTIVTSYADPREITPESIARLRAFLHRLGREARQGEIGIVFDQQYIGITAYDEGS